VNNEAVINNRLIGSSCVFRSVRLTRLKYYFHLLEIRILKYNAVLTPRDQILLCDVWILFHAHLGNFRAVSSVVSTQHIFASVAVHDQRHRFLRSMHGHASDAQNVPFPLLDPCCGTLFIKHRCDWQSTSALSRRKS
jgi:hypothetical protein